MEIPMLLNYLAGVGVALATISPGTIAAKATPTADTSTMLSSQLPDPA